MDSLLRRHLGELFDFFGRAAESGALQQVGSAIVIPIGGGDRREIALHLAARGGSLKAAGGQQHH